MKIWQQAAGDGDRNYLEICQKWGVILNGPGHGAWKENAREHYLSRNVSARKCTDIARFAEEMSEGDLVVLREGTHTVHGVGRIVGDYMYHQAFLDIDGWDIPHVRRVKWLWLPNSDESAKRFETYSLNQGDPTQLLPETERTTAVRHWLDSKLKDNKPSNHRTLRPLPENVSAEIDLVIACELLYECGVASKSITSLQSKISDLARLAGWYRRNTQGKYGISEHETVAQLVVPLMSALGWSPQLLGLEWKPKKGGQSVDVVAFRPFRGAVRSDEDIVLLLEAKRFDSSCLKGLDQAVGYASSLKKCRRLVVTDGIRYAIFYRAKTQPTFGSSPKAYLNLALPRSTYPIMGSYGAREALLMLSPEWHDGLLPEH